MFFVPYFFCILIKFHIVHIRNMLVTRSLKFILLYKLYARIYSECIAERTDFYYQRIISIIRGKEIDKKRASNCFLLFRKGPAVKEKFQLSRYAVKPRREPHARWNRRWRFCAFTNNIYNCRQFPTANAPSKLRYAFALD